MPRYTAPSTAVGGVVKNPSRSRVQPGVPVAASNERTSPSKFTTNSFPASYAWPENAYVPVNVIGPHAIAPVARSSA